MMKEIFKTVPIALTPLSPLHIGCGEDFEPTGFILDTDNKLLLSFEPSRIHLTNEQRQDLFNCLEGRDPIRAVQSFYKQHKALYRGGADAVLPYDKDLDDRFKSLTQGLLIRDSNIQRSCYTIRDYKPIAYVPGTALKGAIHTALLDDLCNKSSIQKLDKFADLDKEILGGKMEKSPMSLLSVSDLLPNKDVFPKTRLVIIRRFYKEDTAKNLNLKKGLAGGHEIILKGQYRLFHGAINLREIPKSTKPLPEEKQRRIQEKKIFTSYQSVFKALNTYSRKEFDNELRYWEGASTGTDIWIKSMRLMLTKLNAKLDAGEIALVRLGKGTGAANITLRKEGIAQIKCKKIIRDYSVTACSADENYVNETESGTSYLPLGWCILEVESQNSDAVKEFCSTIERINPRINVEKILAGYEAEEQEAKRIAQKAAEEEQKLQSMSAEEKRIMDLKAAIDAAPQIKPGTDLHKAITTAVEEAKSWPESYRIELADEILKVFKSKGLDAGKSGKTLKANLRALKEGN